MTPLAHEALLSTLAERNIAVVGFSMVAGILRTESLDDEIRLFTLRDVAELGLLIAVMCVFPLVVYAFDTLVASTWRFSSGAPGLA